MTVRSTVARLLTLAAALGAAAACHEGPSDSIAGEPRLVLVPESVALVWGGPAKWLEARFLDGDGQLTAGTVSAWSNGDTAIVGLGPSAEAPNFAAVSGTAVGTATITVAGSGLLDTATITVVEGAVRTVSVSPVVFSSAGTTKTVDAVPYDSTGNRLLHSHRITWSSSDTTVATVVSDPVPLPQWPLAERESRARVTSLRAGTATITATLDSISATLSVDVPDCSIPTHVSCEAVRAFHWMPNSGAIAVLTTGGGGTGDTSVHLWRRDAAGRDRLIGTLGPTPAPSYVTPSYAVAAAPDGSAYYAIVGTATRIGTLWRVSDDGATLSRLSDSVESCGRLCAILEVSPDGRYVLYRRFPQGDLWAYDVVAERESPLVAGAPRAFSPDGRTLLFQAFSDTAVWGRIDLAGGQRSNLPSRYSGSVAAAWDAQGIHLLVHAPAPNGAGLAILDVATGTQRVIKEECCSESYSAALAPDLSHAAFLGHSWMGAYHHFYPLLTADAATRTIQSTGVDCGNAFSAPPPVVAPQSYVRGQPAFSPDGRFVACVAQHGLAVVAVP